MVVNAPDATAENPVIIEGLNFELEEATGRVDAITVESSNITVKNCSFKSA